MEVVVFTNGCFDILHPGHLDLLEKAKKLGTKLIVGINSDESVRTIKGSPRPFVSEKDRATMLLGLKPVDEVVIFNETTPQKIIEQIKPDVLVKGGDWSIEQIIGASYIKNRGGQVFSIPLKEGYSTTSIAEKFETDKESIENSVAKSDFVGVNLRDRQLIIEMLIKNDSILIEKSGQIIAGSIKKGNKVILSCSREEFLFLKYVADNIHKNIKFELIQSDDELEFDGKPNVFIVLDSSNKSDNLIESVIRARENGCQTIALTGRKGKKLSSLCDVSILISSERVSRIREAHITIFHLWLEMLESDF